MNVCVSLDLPAVGMGDVAACRGAYSCQGGGFSGMTYDLSHFNGYLYYPI